MLVQNHLQDIKPANLLVDHDDSLKITDFGLARLFEVDTNEHTGADEADTPYCYSPQVASRWYRAPELLWGSPHYGPAIDLWAAGCVLAEMMREAPLFSVRI